MISRWSEVQTFSPRPIYPSLIKFSYRYPLNILVSNDDGITSEGIKALADILKTLGNVYVVAPDRERSASGHSLTLNHPLRVEEIKKNYLSVDGTPTDCVNLAMNGLLAHKPDIVVSGINKGANMGDDITYSGTVAAAMEGTLLGVPSIAISLAGKNGLEFSAAAGFAKKAARFVLDNGMPKDTLLNINVPNIESGKIKGYRVTRQGKRIYGDTIIEKTDPRGRKYFWVGGDVLGYEKIENSDFNAISEGYISITPVHLDLTNFDSIDEIRKWEL